MAEEFRRRRERSERQAGVLQELVGLLLEPASQDPRYAAALKALQALDNVAPGTNPRGRQSRRPIRPPLAGTDIWLNPPFGYGSGTLPGTPDGQDIFADQDGGLHVDIFGNGGTANAYAAVSAQFTPPADISAATIHTTYVYAFSWQDSTFGFSAYTAGYTRLNVISFGPGGDRRMEADQLITLWSHSPGLFNGDSAQVLDTAGTLQVTIPLSSDRIYLFTVLAESICQDSGTQFPRYSHASSTLEATVPTIIISPS
jgi:hypothetical protein